MEDCSVNIENGNTSKFVKVKLEQNSSVSVDSFSTSLKIHHGILREIDHEIFSTVILSLPLIQEGQLSVSGERICTILVNRLED